MSPSKYLAAPESCSRNAVFACTLISECLAEIETATAEVSYRQNTDSQPTSGLPRQEIDLQLSIGVRHLYRSIGVAGQRAAALRKGFRYIEGLAVNRLWISEQASSGLVRACYSVLGQSSPAILLHF